MLIERVSKMLWKGFSMNPNSWMENPALSGIDPAKLQLLTSLAGQAQGKSQNELLPFLMSAASGLDRNHYYWKRVYHQRIPPCGVGQGRRYRGKLLG